jgi:hypothetical protein
MKRSLTEKQIDIIESYFELSLYVLTTEPDFVLNEILENYEKYEMYEKCEGIKRALEYNDCK